MTRMNPGDIPKRYRDQTENNRPPVKSNGRAELVIPGQLPALNEIIQASKTHWSQYSKLKKKYSDLIEDITVIHRTPFFRELELDITYYCRDRRKDPDNIAAGKKFILDGLVAAGVIKDDGWKCVKGFNERWQVDKENPRVEVVLKDVG